MTKAEAVRAKGGEYAPAFGGSRNRIVVCAALLLIHMAVAWFYTTMRVANSDAAWSDFPLDDSWIHMVYGRSVAHSGLPAYNDGEMEAGFTSPLWVIACAAAHWIAMITPLSVVISLKLIGILCASAMSVAAYELARAWSSREALAWFAGIACAVTPHLAFSQVSGMETALAAAAALWTAVFLHQRRYIATGVALAAAYWARPEMLLLAPLIGCGLAVDWWWNRLRIRAVDWAKLFAPLALCGLAWIAFCYSINGHPLPNTFYTKAKHIDYHDIAVVLLEFAWDEPLRLRGTPQVDDPGTLTGAGWNNPFNFVGVGLVLWLIGAWSLQNKLTAARLVAIVFPWVFLIAIPLSRQMLPRSGTFFSVARYALPAMPFLFVVITVGLNRLWNWTSERAASRRRRVEIWPRAVALGCVVLMLLRVPGGLYRNAQLFAWNCRNIDEMQVELGKWVAANIDSRETFLLNDAGALRYFGGRRAIDMCGLNWHEFALNRELRMQVGASPDRLDEFMRAHQARYVILFNSCFPLLVTDPDFPRQFRYVSAARCRPYTILPADLDTMFIYRRVSD